MELEQSDFLQAQQRCSKCLLTVPLLLMAVVFIAGCTSPGVKPQVEAFACAVTLTTSNVEHAYALAEQKYFDEQFSVAFDDYIANHDLRLKPIPTLMTPQDLTVKINMLNGLNEYASRLSSLLGNAPLTNLDYNAAQLGLTLSNLNQTAIEAAFVGSNTVAAGDFKIVTEAVNFIGNWIISAEEQRQAQKSVEHMQKYFPSICNVFSNDMFFVRNSVKQDSDITADRLYKYLHTNADHLDPLELRSEVRRIAVDKANAARLDNALALTEASLGKLADAHKDMAASFTNYDTNLTSFVAAIITEAQDAATTYGSTQTNK
jgi:hypothetical protein